MVGRRFMPYNGGMKTKTMGIFAAVAAAISLNAAPKAAGDATKREMVRADSSGRLVLRRTLAPWSLVLVREL